MPNNKAYAVYAARAIRADGVCCPVVSSDCRPCAEPIAVYAGLLTQAEDDRLEQSNGYLFDVTPAGFAGNQFYVDASSHGNEARCFAAHLMQLNFQSRFINDAWPLASTALGLRRRANCAIDVVWDHAQRVPVPVPTAAIRVVILLWSGDQRKAAHL